MYPNQLRDPNSFLYPLIYFSIHLVAFYLFLAAGSNPGFVDETDTPESRKAKARMFVQNQYDEFRDVKDDIVSCEGTIDLETATDRSGEKSINDKY